MAWNISHNPDLPLQPASLSVFPVVIVAGHDTLHPSRACVLVGKQKAIAALADGDTTLLSILDRSSSSSST